MTDHAELRRLAKAATPGPWTLYVPEDYQGPDELPGYGVECAEGRAIVWGALEPETGCQFDRDAEFIAAANPQAILALLDEIDGMKASGWRNHSVNYARAEKCPQTLETAQAAWDRDQELIEEQRQQIARDSQTINQLRQGMKGDYDIDAWLEWTREKDRIKAQNDALQGALHAVQAEVDGNLRPLTRDLVNMVSGLNNGTHPNDIYEYCDEIERIIGAALEGATQ
ncbi:ead/Ea22-like family protein [Pseudomonas aeruginosa]|nr:ead/Ea22-like family protein [Pseudomonas aeruginosa]MDS9771623.1 ead/Ea22-like family protein [Pseudomonas aeruginosa]